jgi:ABC-type histidine transport system ATPase subunit
MKMLSLTRARTMTRRRARRRGVSVDVTYLLHCVVTLLLCYNVLHVQCDGEVVEEDEDVELDEDKDGDKKKGKKKRDE